MNEIETLFFAHFYHFYPYVEIVPQQKIGKYIADFVIGKLVIEIDGKEFHERPDQVHRDKQRDREIALHGFSVIRYPACEVYNNTSEVVDEVYKISLAMNKVKQNADTYSELVMRKVVPCTVTRIRTNFRETSEWFHEDFYDFGLLVCDSLNKGWDVNVRRVKPK